MDARHPLPDEKEAERLRIALGDRLIVLIGMMGAGKTSIGRRVANVLGLPFLDADHEIEKAANLSIPEIFENYGEAHFREGEQRVIARLLGDGPGVLATGGGAFMNAQTRQACAEHGVTVWLKADVPIMLERIRKKSNRPLLSGVDPEKKMRELLTVREPVYALADIVIASRDGPHNAIVAELLDALKAHLSQGADA